MDDKHVRVQVSYRHTQSDPFSCYGYGAASITVPENLDSIVTAAIPDLLDTAAQEAYSSLLDSAAKQDVLVQKVTDVLQVSISFDVDWNVRSYDLDFVQVGVSLGKAVKELAVAHYKAQAIVRARAKAKAEAAAEEE